MQFVFRNIIIYLLPTLIPSHTNKNLQDGIRVSWR